MEQEEKNTTDRGDESKLDVLESISLRRLAADGDPDAILRCLVCKTLKCLVPRHDKT